MSTYIKYIKLGLVVVITAMVYACGSDPISSPTSPPLKPIADEIRKDSTRLSYKETIDDSPATNLFSRGDINNPYLFSFRVESVDLIEEIEAEIRITEKGNTNKVLYEEKQMAMENSFSIVMDTTTRKARGVLEEMYVVSEKTLQGKNDFESLTDGEGDGNPENSFEDFRSFRDGEVFVVGIGPSEENPVDFSQFNRDDELTIRARILHKGEVIKEGSIDISAADPYDIYTWRDLQSVDDDLTGDYQVMNHIVFPKIGHYGYDSFRPIGNSSGAGERGFTGTFDGHNYEIRGMYVVVRTNLYGGLFARANGATIQNIKLYHKGVGGHVGISGGLLGRLNGGTVRNCHVYSLEGARVKGQLWIGGLIGHIESSDGSSLVEDSSADTDIWNWLHVGHAGGLVGLMKRGKILNSHATGNVKGAKRVGGLVGRVSDSSLEGAIISNVYATGDVSGDSMIGGLIGEMTAEAFVSGHATGDVKGNNDAGGLVGVLSHYKKSASSLVGYASGDVEGNSQVGGLIGAIKHVDGNSVSTTVVRGYSVGNVFGNSNIGGLVGSIQPYDASWEESQKKSQNDLHDIKGYARGKVVIMSIQNPTDTAGLLIGNVFAPHGKVGGYTSTSSSGLVGIDNGKAKGTKGTEIATAAINNDYMNLFSRLTFGDDTGQWTWVGPEKWPAINAGDKSPVAEQPLGEDALKSISGIQEEQQDTALQGIEMLEDNKFKVYETHGVYYEKRRIGNSIPQIDFLPTGLYIKPNATITVTVDSDYSLNRNLRLFTGTYSRYREGWDPDGFILKKGKNVIVNPRGNSRFIYLRLTTKSDRLIKTATVTIEGASKAPFFIHGKTKSADFQKMLEDYDYESILIASDRIMLVVTKEKALRVKDQDWEETASLLDTVVERAEYIHGLDGKTYYDVPPSTRILAVERDENGGPWSATHYRVMAPRSGIIGWVDNTKIVNKYWALWHEVGHMYETWQLMMSEVNVNIYTLAVEREFNKQNKTGNKNSYLVRDGTWAKIKTYLAKPEKDFFNEKYGKQVSVSMRLGMLQQLWLGYGKTDEERDQFYIKLHKKVRRESAIVRGRSKEAVAYLIVKASEVYGRNLSDFFKAWGIDLPEAFEAIEKLPDPDVDLTTLSE